MIYYVDTTVTNAQQKKIPSLIRHYKGNHENACVSGRPLSSVVIPFVVDSLGNFCSVAIIFLKKIAKIKFEKIRGSKGFQDLTASTWINTTCRDLQAAIIKTCAYNDRSALKLAFGEEYDKSTLLTHIM